jgi:hypothetical protein
MFDFWLGDWIVYDTAMNHFGNNKIIKLADGCILNENWRSIGNSTGSSFNYYNATDSTWNQVWIDNQGVSLVLKGKAEKYKMVMENNLQPFSSGGLYKNQISWTLNQDKSVSQTWSILNQKNQVISVASKGIYVKK